MSLYEILTISLSCISALATFCAVVVALYNARLPYKKRLKIINREEMQTHYDYDFYKKSVNDADILILNQSYGDYKIQSIRFKYRNKDVEVKEILTESGVATLPYTLESFESIGIESIGLAMSNVFAIEEYANVHESAVNNLAHNAKQISNFLADLHRPKFLIASAYAEDKVFYARFPIRYYREAHQDSAKIVNKVDIFLEKQSMKIGENKFLTFFYKEVAAFSYKSTYLANKIIEKLDMLGERESRLIPSDKTIVYLKKDEDGVIEKYWYVSNGEYYDEILTSLQMTSDLTEK